MSSRNRTCRLLWGAVLLQLASPCLLPATPPEGPVRSLETLRDRQAVGVRLLAAISASLPDLLWLRHVTFDARSATLDGASWSSSGAGELVERLGKAPIASFGPPKLVSARAGEDGYDAFSVVLPYLGPAASAGSEDLLQRVAPRAELAKLQRQVRAALKDVQLAIQDYRTGAKAVPEGPVDLWPVSIRIEGATFAQVGAFLERLSRLPRLVVLEELRLEARDKDRPVLSVLLRLSLPVLGEKRELPERLHRAVGADAVVPRHRLVVRPRRPRRRSPRRSGWPRRRASSRTTWVYTMERGFRRSAAKDPAASRPS